MIIAEAMAAPFPEPLTAGLVARTYPEMIPILDGRAVTDWAERDLAWARAGFDAERFLALPRLLSDPDALLVGNYYRHLVGAGFFTQATDPNRLVMSDDPVGQALLRQFLPITQKIVGRSIRESYTFAAVYQPGMGLRMHTDRIECEYTISLFLDYDRLPPGERSPWPLHVESPLHEQPLRFHQARGDGVLLKGRELLHGRPAMLENDHCLVLMLHYVDASATGI